MKRQVNKSILFSYAWLIANIAAVSFGDSPSAFFAESLKLSWGKLQSVDHFRLIRSLARPYKRFSPSDSKNFILPNQIRIKFSELYT